MEGLNLDFRSPNELLNLKDLSITAAASLIWDSKEMKMAIDEVLHRYNFLWRDPKAPLKMEKSCIEDLSVKISETVTNIFNNGKDQISLPQVLIIEIEKKVLEKVEKMINWILYLIRILKLDYKAAERIYWTTDGNIDEDKIFRFFWWNQLVGEPVKWEGFDNNLTLLQYLACFFGQEEFITLHQSDYIEAIKPLEIDNNDIVLNIMKNLIAYYDNLYLLTSNYNLGRVKFHTTNMPIVGILYICKRFCFHKPFLFFWNRLDATERFNFLETQSKAWSLRRDEASVYGTEQRLKIMLFLMEQMNERQKYNFILNNFSDVILTFSRNKNCKKFCMPLVEHYLPTLSAADKYNFIMNCAEICNRSNQFDFELEIIKRSIKNERICRIIKPDCIIMVINKNSSLRAVKTFFENFNIPALKLIIKDESLECQRKDLINFGQRKYRELIRCNNFQLLDKFLDEVLSSKAEKDKFKQDFNFLGEWISECWFDIVDNVLIWMHGAASQEFKTPYINLFCSSIPTNYEAIEKLLRWFFDAQGPLINNCQNKLELLNELCSGLIYNLWFPEDYNIQDRHTASTISTKILIFSFFSEGEIQNFKTNVLANEEKCIKFFCENKLQNNWGYHQLLYVLNDFLNFCNLPKETEDYIKSSLNEKVPKLAFKPQERRGPGEKRERLIVT